MIFIAAATEPTMILMLTEQDVADMRGGRTKFVDKTATKSKMFNKVIISLHKNQAEIENDIRRAGHGALLQNLPSIVPEPEDGVCEGCNGVMKEYLILDGCCIACWRERARAARGRDVK